MNSHASEYRLGIFCMTFVSVAVIFCDRKHENPFNKQSLSYTNSLYFLL